MYAIRSYYELFRIDHRGELLDDPAFDQRLHACPRMRPRDVELARDVGKGGPRILDQDVQQGTVEFVHGGSGGVHVEQDGAGIVPVRGAVWGAGWKIHWPLSWVKAEKKTCILSCFRTRSGR